MPLHSNDHGIPCSGLVEAGIDLWPLVEELLPLLEELERIERIAAGHPETADGSTHAQEAGGPD